MSHAHRTLLSKLAAEIPVKGDAVPRPDPSRALYVHPNPDGSRKNCVNCIMWSLDDRCSILPADKEVEADDVCGYHVFGNPMKKRMVHEGMDAIPPDLAGLEHIPGGTSCNICKYYEKKSSDGGICHAVHVKGKPAPVEAMGCCALWDGI